MAEPIEKESGIFQSIYPQGFNPYKIRWFDILIAFLITLVVLVVYVKTLAPSVVAGDSGELTTEVYNMGACHPPGYPLYGIVGKLFTYLPFGDVGYRINLYMAVFGAATVFLLYLFCIKLLGFNRDTGKPSIFIQFPAAAAALVFAFSLDFWGQSVGSGKFYPMNAFLIIFMLFIMRLWYEEMLYFRHDQKLHFAQRMTIFLGFVMGLSLTVHQLPLYFIVAYAIVLLPFTLVLIVSERGTAFKQELKDRSFIFIMFIGAAIVSLIIFWVNAYSKPLIRAEDVPYIMTAIFLVPTLLTLYTFGVKAIKPKENWVDRFFETFTIGIWMFIFAFSLYLYLMVRAIALAPLPDPKPLSWGDTQTFDILFNHIMRKQYGMGGNSDLNNFLGQITAVAKFTIQQYNWINIIVGLLGLIYLFKRDNVWALYTLVAVLISDLALIKFINFETDPRTVFIQKFYFIQLHMVIGVYIACGFQLILDLAGQIIKLNPKKQIR